MSTDTLRPFLYPTGIAVVGATAEPGKLGATLTRNLLTCGYKGAVYPVNPKGGAVFGHPAYSSITELPDPVDLAFVLIPPALVVDAVQSCAARGIRNVIVGTGGFRETGPEGKAREAELTRTAAACGVRIIGPNCIGLINNGASLYATFLPPPAPPAGDLAFVSQSGAICAATIDLLRGKDSGVSVMASLGNQSDVDETDLLELLVDHEDTRAVALYLEGVRGGQKFVNTAARVSRHKPVVALKVGRSEAGKRAAASHTGALAGSMAAYDAAFRKAGVLVASNTRELIELGAALAWCRPIQRPNIAVLTNAGGPGVTAADALERLGMNVPVLESGTRAALGTFLPGASGFNNPVDMLAAATPEMFARALALLLADAAIDGVMVITPTPPATTAVAIVDAMAPIIAPAQKPVTLVLMGDPGVHDAAERARRARIPVFTYPEDAARALAALYERGTFLAREPEPAPVTLLDAEAVMRVLAGAVPDAEGWLDPETTFALMSAAGIDVPATFTAGSAEAAVACFHRIGAPVALKAWADELTHKSDHGGVILGLGSDDQVREAFSTIEARTSVPGAGAFRGVAVQQMAPEGQDVILGIAQDPQFGYLMMFGTGGTEAELWKDVAFTLLPLTTAEADALIDGTVAGRRLHGFRSLPPADRTALVHIMFKLDVLVRVAPEIREIEANPLRVRPSGGGSLALDIRIRLRS